MTEKPGCAMQDVRWAEGPYIVRRGARYLLHYRVAVDRTEAMQMQVVVAARRERSKGYYYFVGLISRPETGDVVERPLEADGLTQLAEQGAVYWLNPDGTEIPLRIKRE